MSDKDDPLEFSALDLMPDWAQESKTPEKPKTYQERPDRGGDRDRRGGGGGGNRGGRRDDGNFRGRQGGGGGGGNRNFDRNDRGRGGPRQGGRGGDDRRGGGGGRNDRRGGRNDRRGGGGRFDRDRPPLEPVPEHVAATLEPTEAAAKALAKHIIESVRTFPLVDLAKMVLSQRERYQVRFKTTDPDKDLYQCRSDGSAWLTKEEAIAHALKSHALETYYKVEEIDADPPKGNFNAVAVCGLSGEILGPSNHHEYQKNIAKLHAERFSNMSLERYKSRINMANDEETIEKWKTQVSRKRQYRLKSDEPEVEEKEEDAKAELPEEEDTSAAETSVAETEAETTPVETEEPAAAETSEEPPTEEPGEAETTAESSGDETESSGDETERPEDPPAEAEAKTESEPVATDGIVLESDEALNRHFRENFADSEIAAAKELVVSGNIPARDLSRGLLEHLKKESEKLRRGFPLPMIQALCKSFEKEHLKFFKRGKKALHVSPVRPKALNDGDQLTERIQRIVDFISDKGRPMVVDLLDHLVEEFQKPDPKKKEKAPELTDKAKEVLTDLRWLTGEGFVLEFPNTRLELGKKPGGQGQNQQQGAPKKKAAKKKVATGRRKESTPRESKPETKLPEEGSEPSPETPANPAEPEKQKGEAEEPKADSKAEKEETTQTPQPAEPVVSEAGTKPIEPEADAESATPDEKDEPVSKSSEESTEVESNDTPSKSETTD